MHAPTTSNTTLTLTQCACLLAAPLALIAGRVLATPFEDNDQTAHYLNTIAAHHTRSDIGTTLTLLGAMLLVPAILGLAGIVRTSMPRLSWLSAGLSGAGVTALAMVATLGFVGGEIAKRGTTPDNIKLWLAIFGHGAAPLVAQTMLAAGALGSIMLAVGLYRSPQVQRAAAVLVGLGSATVMLTSPGPVRVVRIAAATLLLVGAGWVVGSPRTAKTEPASDALDLLPVG